MEQSKDVVPTTDSVTAVDQARKPLLSEQKITEMPMSTQKTEKVKWDNLLLRKLDIWVNKDTNAISFTYLYVSTATRQKWRHHGWTKRKNPKELQKPPLKEENLEEAAPAETTEKVKLQKNVQRHTEHLSIFLRERTLNYNENNEHI